jgi:type VI secretion system protein ImpG
MDERLIRLFEEELRHVRETAAEFGRAFPDRAKHLDPKSRPFEGMVADPYVERLLEGVAFLAARVRLKLDAQFPQFTQGLLETVYPDFLAPLPSMAIFQLAPDPTAPPPPEGLLVKRDTKIQGFPAPAEEARTATREPTPCTFSLAHDIRLLPVELSQADWLVRRLHEARLPADWKARAALRLRFRKTVLVPWAEISLDPLVVFVPKSDGLGYEILEELFSHQLGLVIRDGRGPEYDDALQARGEPVRKFGFDPSAALLPSSPRTFEGHRLLREYFALPERFFFFELKGFQAALAKCVGNELELIIALDEASNRLEQQVKAPCFRLYCAPGINLFSRRFSQVVEPDRFSEFQVVPDANRPLDFEVYSIESVEGFSDSSPFGHPFKPFFETHPLHREGKAFFTVSRQPRSRAQVPGSFANGAASPYAGSEVFLALVDAEQAPFDGDLNQLVIGARLSNRHLPIALAENPSRWVPAGGLKAQITPLVGPTCPSYRPVDGPYAWRLLNLLSINYLSLSDEKGDGAAGLRELLALYAGDEAEWATQQIGALRGVSTHTVPRPLYESNGSSEMPRIAAIVRGMEIALCFEEAAFLDMSVVVLGAVLEEFFARYAALNSFTETVMITPDGRQRMRWPARPGLKPLS